MKPNDYPGFTQIEAAAIKGARCPQKHELHKRADVPAMARLGLIDIEISGRNWRQVTILVGQHKGKKTAPNPQGYPTWQVLNAHSPRRQYLRDADKDERERKRLWTPPQG